MARNRILLLVLLSVAACSAGIRLFAQEVDLPEVTWKDANGKEFRVGDKLVLHFQSQVPGDQLRARVFRKSKQELIAQGKTVEGKYCVIYSSTVFTHSDGLHDQVGFNWYPDMGSLQRRSDGGNDDQVYTIVLEKRTNDNIQAFRLAPNDVSEYFNRGLEITIKADGYQTAGIWATVEKVGVVVQAKAAEIVGHLPIIAAAGGGAPSRPMKAVAARPSADFANTTDCIRIHTLRASDSPNPDPEQLTAQLVPEPCVLVGQPTTFHLPAGLLHSGWVLR